MMALLTKLADTTTKLADTTTRMEESNNSLKQRMSKLEQMFSTPVQSAVAPPTGGASKESTAAATPLETLQVPTGHAAMPSPTVGPGQKARDSSSSTLTTPTGKTVDQFSTDPTLTGHTASYSPAPSNPSTEAATTAGTTAAASGYNLLEALNKEGDSNYKTPHPRRMSMVPATFEPLVAKIPRYVVKLYNGEVHDHELTTQKVSLRPMKQLTHIDVVVKDVLKVSAGNLRPASHITIPSEGAYRMNQSIDTATATIQKEYLSVLETYDHSSAPANVQFLPRTIAKDCINKALAVCITNPIFMGQQLLAAVRDCPATKALWTLIKRPYLERGTKDAVKPVHILDLYAVSHQETDATTVNNLIKEYSGWSQRNSKAMAYLNVKTSKLEQLLGYYDHKAMDPTAAREVEWAVDMMLSHIASKATGRFLYHILQDKDTEDPSQRRFNLPYEARPDGTDRVSLQNFVSMISAKLTAVAVHADKETEHKEKANLTDRVDKPKNKKKTASAATTKSTGNSNSSRARKQNDKKRTDDKFPTDQSKKCTHSRCRNLPEHNVGGVDECSRFCRLKDRNMKCPNEGKINDKDGRHFYIQSCQDFYKSVKKTSGRGAGSSATVNLITVSDSVNTDEETPNANDQGTDEPQPVDIDLMAINNSAALSNGYDSDSEDPPPLLNNTSDDEDDDDTTTAIDLNNRGNNYYVATLTVTDADFDDQVHLDVQVDTGATIVVLCHAAFEKIKHLATEIEPTQITTASPGDRPKTTMHKTYRAHWRCRLRGRTETFKFVVGAIDSNVDGLLPGNMACEDFNIWLSVHNVAQFAEPEWAHGNDASTLYALGRQDILPDTYKNPVNMVKCEKDFVKINQQFAQLLEKKPTPTQGDIEELLRDVPQEEHPHGFDIEKALTQMLTIQKVENSLTEVQSELYLTLLKKIKHYQLLDRMSPHEEQAHRNAVEILDKYRKDITTPDKFPTYNEKLAAEMIHRPEFKAKIDPYEPVRAIRMSPPVQKIYEEWHDKQVEHRNILRATPEDIRNHKIKLHHLPVLKRGATRPYKLADYRFALNGAPLKHHIVPAKEFKFATRLEIGEFIKGNKYFSAIDISKFFPSIPADYGGYFLHYCRGQLYKYAVVVQGEPTSVAAGHRVMSALFGDLVADNKLMIHVDDLLLATKTTKEHLELLDTIFSRLKAAGLNINAAKSTLLRPTVRFLGLVISREGTEVDLMRYDSLVLWPSGPKTTKRQATRMVCFMMYFHNYIRDCSKILSPIRDAIQAPGKFRFTQECQDAFDEVRARLIQGTVLHHVDYQKTFHIRVDTATSNGIGAVLYQEDDNGAIHPVLFQSRRLTDAERNYTPTDAELLGVYWATTQAFHDYVQFSPIIIHSDHKNLERHLHVDTATSRRRKRWCYYLQDYDICGFVHEEGKTFTDADTLSRIKYLPDTDSKSAPTKQPNKATVNEITNNSLRVAQADDKLCQDITDALDGKDVPRRVAHIAARCRRTNGILYYHDYVLRRDEDTWILILPEAWRDNVIQSHHESATGHQGAHGTTLTIRRHWWWPAMVDDVRDYVKHCEICTLARTTGNALSQGTLSTYQAVTPLQTMAIDLYEVAPAPGESPSEYKCILTCVYAFTRMIDAIPLKSKSASEVARALLTVWTNHGFPSSIRHDQGPEFDGEVARICDELAIRQIRSAPHSPQSNGMVERVNEELKRELRRFSIQNPGTPWDHHLPLILLKLRTTQSSATNYSPYELTAICTPIPQQVLAEERPVYDFTDDKLSTEMIDSHVAKLSKVLYERHTKALANDIQVRDKRLVDQNKGRKPLTFTEGDWVRLLHKTRSKTQAQATKAYKVTGVIDTNRYSVTDPDTGRQFTVFIGQMIRSEPPQEAQSAAPAAPTNGPEAAIVQTTTPLGIKYYVMDPKTRIVYTNRRPNSAAAQARWGVNAAIKPIQNYTQQAVFHFKLSKDGYLTIPLKIRKQFPDFEDIQGRKYH